MPLMKINYDKTLKHIEKHNPILTEDLHIFLEKKYGMIYEPSRSKAITRLVNIGCVERIKIIESVTFPFKLVTGVIVDKIKITKKQYIKFLKHNDNHSSSIKSKENPTFIYL